jgi:glucose-6-phosphate isomerase
MKKLKLDYSRCLGFVNENDIEKLSGSVAKAHQMLHNRTGAGNEYSGWVQLPINYNRDEFAKIKEAADKIKSDSQALIVIGIGGSYLGARAAIEALSHSFFNLLPDSQRKAPQVFFAGNNISSKYISQLLDVVKDRDISVNVVSKSGTTTEPAIAFRVFKELMEKKYGKSGASKRIYATTDRSRGALREMAREEGYETFIIPDDIGGRYSVLTAVGLLPIASAGIDVEKMMEGAEDACNDYNVPELDRNDCYLYAAVRNALYAKGKTIEVMVNYEPSLHYFTEWWKQLFGESEGKDGKGIFPAGVDFTTDLHSMGQYLQDGLRNLFETVINIEKSAEEILIKDEDRNTDGLNYLAGKGIDFVNKKAMEGTLLAHVDGGVPNLLLNVPELDAYYFGSMVYFFEKACGISGYLLGVNPFNQPGVEAYKKNVFALLGKPGYEGMKKALEKRLISEKCRKYY